MVADSIQILPFITDEGARGTAEPLSTEHKHTSLGGKVQGLQAQEVERGMWGGVGPCASPAEKRQVLLKICLYLVSASNRVSVQPHGVIIHAWGCR